MIKKLFDMSLKSMYKGGVRHLSLPQQEKAMTIYKFVENALTKEEVKKYSRLNDAIATGAQLIVASENGESSTEYVIFKREPGKRPMRHCRTVIDWDNGSVMFAAYSSYKRIRKSDGAVLDNDFEF